MKKTPWFPGTVKPVHVGVYQRDYASRVAYCKWDGVFWYWAAPRRKEAQRECGKSISQTLPWRGLAEKP